ncbi:methionine synthase [Fervidobacterium pennivorans subsp. keratinolyticus]|nr:methionine synthase [Fervidobacterium pennivorans subsp. keratinolyticus]
MVELQIFIPEKYQYMPSKKIFLARAGVIYSKAIDDEKLLEIANKIYLKGLEVAKPFVYWDVFKKDQIPETAIPGKFKQYDTFLVFISTLGNTLDEEIENLSQTSTLEAMLLDAWGSEAIEKLNDTFEQIFKSRNNCELTMRFSPGYGDLHITVNKTYVELLGVTDKITVLDTGLMIPRKTTTCIAGIVT